MSLASSQTTPSLALPTLPTMLSRRLESGFVVIAFITMMDAVVRMATTGGDQYRNDLVEGNLIYQLTGLTVDLITLFLLMLRPRAALLVCRRNKLLCLLVLLAVVSVFWSSNPAVSFRRNVGLTGTTLFGIYVATRFSPSEFLTLLSRAFVIVIGLSMIAVVLLPQYGIHNDHHLGYWRGVFMYKNALGRAMGLATLLFLYLTCYGPRVYQLRSLLCCPIALLLLVMSGSRTAWIGTATAILLFPLLRICRARPKFLLPGLALFGQIVLAAILLFSSNPDYLFRFLGRDPTLTGRIPIWHSAVAAGMERPWFGYGFRAFWLGEQGGSSTVEMNRFMMHMNHSHNGYLDLWLELGLVGVVLFSIIIIRLTISSTKLILDGTHLSSIWFPIPLTYMLVVGIAEDAILGPHNFIWAVMVSTVIYVTAMRSPSTHHGAVPM